MQWEQNQYYHIVKAKKEAVQVAAVLLHCYPLTGACLEILGKDLLKVLEFGFFSEQHEIITQGSSGKDLFLLCDGTVDVLVDDQIVVQMQGPTLLGDKAIVEPNSKRAATIRVSQGWNALFLKIPMGLFIRNFEDRSIPDGQFKQEVEIFINVFQGVQQRLFNYIYLQKNLWEESNTSLNLINSQAIAKILDNKKDLSWPTKIWENIGQAVASELNFKWPDSIPLSIHTFRDVLQKFLEFKLPQKNFQGTSSDFINQRNQIWRDWMMSVGNQVSKTLPRELLPVNMGDVQLFNPRNYHMRMSTLLKSVEKRFKVKEGEMDLVSGESKRTPPPVTNFFGKGEKSNEFDLKRYLTSFQNEFELKHPMRIMAQVSQRTALIAAECENQFNTSVVTMQKFLSKAQTFTGKAEVKESNATGIDPNEYIKGIYRTFAPYHRLNKSPNRKNLREIRYVRGLTPTMEDLIKCCASKALRAEVERDFIKLFETYDLSTNKLPDQFKKKMMYFLDTEPGDIIPPHELKTNYYFLMSRGIKLMRGNNRITTLPSGLILGGKGWDPPVKKLNTDTDLYLEMPEPSEAGHKNNLLLVIPLFELPWEIDKTPDAAVFTKDHLPIMQWWVNKHIIHLNEIIGKRDSIFDKVYEVEQVIRLEAKVKEFEETAVDLNRKETIMVAKFLRNIIQMKIDPKVSFNSDQLSKKMYNHILKQMGQEYPNLPVEERSNKAYTKWRYVLSDLVSTIDRARAVSGEREDMSSRPVYEIISNEVAAIIETYLGNKGEEYIQLTTENPQFDLTSLMINIANVKTKVMLFKLISTVFESHLCQTYLETYDLQVRYNTAQGQRPQTDAEPVKQKLIEEEVSKLKVMLQGS